MNIHRDAMLDSRRCADCDPVVKMFDVAHPISMSWEKDSGDRFAVPVTRSAF
jgi:hypothetical protein